MLGYEDHGILTYMLDVTTSGAGQGFCGQDLSTMDAAEVIKGILTTVGVQSWEELKGKYIRIERERGLIARIYNILDDNKVFDPYSKE